jgi:Spy/CpxP family protein refolding chaperone
MRPLLLIAAIGMTALCTNNAFAQANPAAQVKPNRANRQNAQGQQRSQAQLFVQALRTLNLPADKQNEIATKLEVAIIGSLTSEQQQQFKDEVAKLKAQPQGQAGQPGGNRFEQLFEGLMLTPEQKTKIDPIVADAQKKMMEQMQAMRQPGADRKEGRQAMQNLMDETLAKIKVNLTAEQKIKLDDAAAQRGGKKRGG